MEYKKSTKVKLTQNELMHMVYAINDRLNALKKAYASPKMIDEYEKLLIKIQNEHIQLEKHNDNIFKK